MLGGKAHLPREVLECDVIAFGVDDTQLVDQRREAVAVVDDIAGIAFLGERTFERQFLEYRTQLQDVLVLGVVAGAHLHVEHAAQGVGVVGVERRGEEVRVADDVGVQSAHQAVASIPHVVVMVGRKHLHALDAVLHTLRRITMNGQAAAVSLARHTGEGHHQTGGVVGTAGKARRLLHRQHHATREHGGVHRRLLVHTGFDDHFLQLCIVLAQGDVHHHFLGT